VAGISDKNPLGQKIMEKTIFVLITILLVFQLADRFGRKIKAKVKSFTRPIARAVTVKTGKGMGRHPKRSPSIQVIIPMAQL
jgi:cell division protein FtsB